MMTGATITTTSTTSATIASSLSDYRGYVLAEIRCALLRASLMRNDLQAIGIALKAGFIDADNALEHLADCNALRLVAPSSMLAST